VELRQLSIPDAYVTTPQIRADDRGVFLEWYRFEALESAIGHRLDLRQANTSVSRKGVVRGIHFADVPPGQAKYVTVARGAVLDYVVDIRVGSPSFGRWEAVRLDDEKREALYIGEGLGHAFVALTDDATVTYLVSDVYTPAAEHGINPLDAEIGLVFPEDVGELLLSPRDVEAPGLIEARDAGLLPEWDVVRGYDASLSAAKGA
jgi:dTDP-4-dehydrorhamnose 3,5-epimerase